MTKRARALALSGFLLALALRAWGARHGLPAGYHPDEPVHVQQALELTHGPPRRFALNNPPLYRELLVLVDAGLYVEGRARGAWGSWRDFLASAREDSSTLTLAARLLSALLGAATALVAGLAAARAAGARAGLLALLLTAVAFLLVRESHFAVNDALAALLATAVLAASVEVLRGGGTRAALAGGVLLGLAISAKYHAAAAAVPLVLAHALRPPPRRAGLAPAALACLAALLLTFPWLVVSPGHVLHDIALNLWTPGRAGWSGLDPAGAWLYYPKVLGWGLGLPLALAGLAGLALALLRRDRALLLVASLPLALYAFMGAQRMYFARFLLPMVPAWIVLASAALDEASRTVEARAPALPRGLVPAAGALLLGVPTLASSVRFDALMSRTDTRDLARAWVDAHVPAGSRIAADWFPFGPRLDAARYEVLAANDVALDDRTLGEYRRAGVRWLVASSFTKDIRLLDPRRDAARQAFFDELSHARLVAELSPGDVRFVYDQIYGPFTELGRLERPGPAIRVYDLAE